jgi:glucose/arabinose dehydrogenase
VGRTGFASRACRITLVCALLLYGFGVQAQALLVTAETLSSGLDHPWALAFAPDGRYLVTERPGRLRVIGAKGELSAPVLGLPPVDAVGQGGLLDLVLATDFARSRRLYFCFAEPGVGQEAGRNSTALASARLSDDAKQLEDLRIIFSQKPKVASRHHFGCRIVLHPDGSIYLTLGDRYQLMDKAQSLNNHAGKVVRIRPDGSVPPGNPFAGQPGALPEIWSYGHRNMQGATLGPDGDVWTHEHGPQGGDEINIVRAGRNYGWPIITYGENYGGGKIGEGITAKPGMEQPLHYWVPSIAPSGMAFLNSDHYGPGTRGRLLVGSLKFGRLHSLTLKNTQVVAEQQIAVGERVRDVRVGPDGLIYVLTDQANGKLLRLNPAAVASRKP